MVSIELESIGRKQSKPIKLLWEDGNLVRLWNCMGKIC